MKIVLVFLFRCGPDKAQHIQKCTKESIVLLIDVKKINQLRHENPSSLMLFKLIVENVSNAKCIPSSSGIHFES